MRLSTIGLTRVIALFELAELNPQGRVFLPSLIPSLIAKCKFQKGPQTFEEFDLSKGVSFEVGTFGETAITKLSFYNDGISMDGRSASTEESQTALLSIMEWLGSEHGLNYGPELVKRWAYLSNVTFYSDADLTFMNPILSYVCKRMTELADGLGSKNLEYRVTRLAFDFDKNQHKIQKGAFLLERLGLARFEDNKYFAEAPLKSDDLLTLLGEIEAGILKSK